MEKALKAAWIDTPLGLMVAKADERALYSLDFAEVRGREEEAEPLCLIKEELEAYFSGNLKEFKTPLFIRGTGFQKRVWEELQKIPFGKTWSYAEVARGIGKPSAFRAVAQANGANRFSIVIPCHRVINSNGEMGGYSSGLGRKKWLLEWEKKIFL